VRSGSRTRELQIIRNRGVSEYHITKPIIAPGVPTLDLRHRKLLVFSKILREKRRRFLFHRKRLPLKISDLKSAFCSVKSYSIALERHSSV